ncbi:AAA family ATPase [Enterococcus faecium]|uniref:AAA family ATPase n=1 Tax=Enterococcus faecium TaxID=1352 RepID=UPI0037702755
MNNEFIPFADIGSAIDYYYDKPVAFCQDILHLNPDEWQENVLNDLAEFSKVSVRSGQGVGKTALEAGAILWFLTCRPYAKVIATAPTMKQLYDVLWAEVAKWLNDSLIKNLLKWTKTKIYMVGDSERWFATARTATKPENMQGFHEDHMLIVVDEASGVSDPIMEAILGTLSGFDNKLLMCGNPNNIEGVFYDSHNSDRDKYRVHKVSSYRLLADMDYLFEKLRESLFTIEYGEIEMVDVLQDDLFSKNHEVEKVETIESNISEGALVIATIDDEKQNVFTLEKVGVI